MRKVSVAGMCFACVFALQASLADTHSALVEFHWIYAKQGATYEQFQNDRDDCAHYAKRPRYVGGIEYSPSSTVFLNCMGERGYALDKGGWDTGVLWTKPYRRPLGNN